MMMMTSSDPWSDRATLPGPPSPDSSALVHALIDGRYRVRSVLGEGSTATVYEVTDAETGRDGALKLMHRRARLRNARERFVREAEMLARLKHPNVVRIDGAGVWNERLYILMELLDGEPLSDLLGPPQHRQLPAPMAVGVFGQAAMGLAAAHAAGVVHRDVKPANLVLLDNGKRLKVIDFGLARDTTLAGALTDSGVVLGSPAYMAPERLAGGAEPDPRWDVWSLGVCLYEALAGRYLYRGTEWKQVAKQIRRSIPRPLRRIRPDLPPELCQLAHRMITKPVASRPKNMVEVASELAAIGRDLG